MSAGGRFSAKRPGKIAGLESAPNGGGSARAEGRPPPAGDELGFG